MTKARTAPMMAAQVGQRVMMIGGVVALVLAAVLWSGEVETTPEAVLMGVLAAISGGLLLLPAVKTSIRGTVQTEPVTSAAWRGMNWPLLILGSSCLAIFTAGNSGDAPLTLFDAMSQHAQMFFLVAGIVLVVRGAGGFGRVYLPELGIDRREWLLVAVIVLVAFLLRLSLADMPLIVGNDRVGEGGTLFSVIELWRRPAQSLLTVPEAAVGETWLAAYLTGLLAEFTGRTLYGLRFMSALAGALTVIAVWWLGRHLHRRETGVLAALLLATFPAHMHLSSLALGLNMGVVVGIAGLGCWARGQRSGDPLDFALAGAGLGAVALFGGVSGLVFPVLGVVGFFFGWWLHRLDKHAARAGFLGLAALLLPLIASRWMTEAVFFSSVPLAAEPWREMARSGVGAYLHHLLEAALLIILPVREGPLDGRSLLGAAPLLIFPYTLAALLGLWVCVWWRRWLLPVVLIVSAVMVSLVAAPAVLDWAAILPVMALLAAVGLVWLGEQGRLWRALPLIAASGIALFGVGYTFGVQQPAFEADYRAARPFGDYESILLYSVEAYPKATRISILTEQATMTATAERLLLFLRDDIHLHVHNPFGLDSAYLAQLDRTVDNALFVPMGEDAIITDLRQQVPDVVGPNLLAGAGLPEDQQYLGFYATATGPTPNYFYFPITAGNQTARNQMIFALVVFALVMVQIPRPFWRRPSWQHYRQYPPGWAIPAVILMCLSALLFIPAERPRALSFEIWVAIGLAVLAGALLLQAHVLWWRNGNPHHASVGTTPALSVASHLHTDQRRYTWVHALLALAGLGLIGFVAAVAVLDFGPDWVDDASHHVQLLALVAGTGLILRAALGTGTGADSAERDPRLVVFRWELLALTVICGLALFLRVWQLNTSITTMVDEVNFISGVLWYWEFDDVPLMEPMSQVISFPRLFNYMQSVTMAVFGRDFAGFRMTSALMGTATVAATWWLTRHLFDRRLALLAALVLATFPPHVHFSRIALNNIADPLPGVLAFAFIARGMLSGRRLDFLLAGLAFGWTAYFFEAGRLLYPPILLVWLIWMWLVDRERFRVNMRPHLLAFSFVAIVVAIPVYVGLYSVTGQFAGRLAASGRSMGVLQALMDGASPRERAAFIDGAAYAYLAYINRPEVYIFYGGAQPLVLMPLVPAFLLGLWQMAARAFWWGRLRLGYGALLIGLWVFATAFANMFLVQTFTSTRFVVAFPAIAILIAAGVVYTLPLLFSAQMTVRGVSVRRAVLVVLFALITVGQSAYYFGPHLDYFNAQFREVRGYRDVEDVVLRSVDFPPGTQVHLFTEWPVFALYTRDILRMLVDDIDITTYQQDNFPSDYFAQQSRDVDHAIFVVSDDTLPMQLAARDFGDDLPDEPQFSTNPDVPLDEQYALYYVPALSSVPPPDIGRDEPYPSQHNSELPFVLLAFIALGGGFVALEYGLRWHGRSIQGRITASQPDLSPTAEHPTL